MHYTAVPRDWKRDPSSEECPVVALCLTGQPGAGCTTVAKYCQDIGIPEMDPAVTSVPKRALEWNPHCVVIDEIEHGFDTDELRTTTDGLTDVLVAEVVVEDTDRRDRLCKRMTEEVYRVDSDVRQRVTRQQLQDTIALREQSHEPYQTPHVQIPNGSDVSETGLIVRLDELTDLIAPNCSCPNQSIDQE